MLCCVIENRVLKMQNYYWSKIIFYLSHSNQVLWSHFFKTKNYYLCTAFPTAEIKMSEGIFRTFPVVLAFSIARFWTTSW